MKGGLSNEPPISIIDMSTSTPKTISSCFLHPDNFASPACIFPLSIACNIVLSLADPGLGVLK